MKTTQLDIPARNNGLDSVFLAERLKVVVAKIERGLSSGRLSLTGADELCDILGDVQLMFPECGNETCVFRSRDAC